MIRVDRFKFVRAIAVVVLALGVWARPAFAQAGPAPDTQLASNTGVETRPVGVNPLDALEDAAAILPGLRNPSTGIPDAQAAGSVGGPANGPGSSSSGDAGGLSMAINVMLVLTVITLVPSIMLMTTCFVRIIVVLALLRQALGTQQLPPAQVITGLALFMTVMVMQPTMERIWDEAVVPYQAGEVQTYDEMWARGVQPLRDFMFDQIEATDNWSSLYTLLEYRGYDISEPGKMTRADVPTGVLVPAYMLSELKVGFVMGFRVYLPFLVIDMVIASILISMSMMMLPPVLISLPFKLLLFVLVDGWTLVVGSLLESFVIEGAMERASAEPSTAALFAVVLVAGVRHPRARVPGRSGELETPRLAQPQPARKGWRHGPR